MLVGQAAAASGSGDAAPADGQDGPDVASLRGDDGEEEADREDVVARPPALDEGLVSTRLGVRGASRGLAVVLARSRGLLAPSRASRETRVRSASVP